MAGGATTPELIAAVSNAGGLGSLGAGYMSADDIYKAIAKIRQLTHKPFSVNLFIPEKHEATIEQMQRAREAIQECCPELRFEIDNIKPPYAPPFEEQMNAILEEKTPIFTFTFGIPSQHWIETFKKKGILLMGTATTVEEAKLLEASGMDAIVAQGREAGGHRGTFLGKAEDALIDLASLVPSIIDSVNIPVIAAGGIMDAKGMLAAIVSGASAVQMGTAFLTCTESGIHANYKSTLLNTTHDNTILTRAFSGKLARGINNTFISRMQSHENDILQYPIQNALTSAMRKEAVRQSDTDFMSMWAGSFDFLCSNLSATEFINKLNHEMLELTANL